MPAWCPLHPLCPFVSNLTQSSDRLMRSKGSAAPFKEVFMRRKLIIMAVSAAITIAGGAVLTSPVSADHKCRDEPGCIFCSSSHSGPWEGCCYICGGFDCTGCND